MRISMTVNDAVQTYDVEPRTLLVFYLRESCGLTGTKIGCDTSSCGACTVLLDGESVKSCTMLAALDGGAEDITDLGDTWQVTTAPGDLHAVRTALEGGGFAIVNADLTMLPSNTIALEDESRAKQVLRVIDALEEHDDVQNVYANFDIPDAVLQSVMA